MLFFAAGQGRLYNLPLSAQRALSFLPGKWEEGVVQDVQSSTQGRFKWWRAAIEEGWIKDWWFGDGFGARLEDLTSARRHGAGQMAQTTGALHSGPLTAIRFVGIVGLALFYVLSIAAAFYSYRCVKKCSGTLLQPVAIYLAIQLTWFPINYALVFGSYDVDMPQQIFLIALLRLVMRMAEEMLAPQSSAARRTSVRTAMVTTSRSWV